MRLLEESAIAERVEIDENGCGSSSLCKLMSRSSHLTVGQLVSTSPSTDKLSNLFKEDLNITVSAIVC